MTTDDAADRAHLEELRRIAYGRTNSVEGEQRATAARRELEDLERVGGHGPAAVDEPATAEAHPHNEDNDNLDDDDVDAGADVDRRNTRSRGWIVPSLVGLTVGLIIGAGAFGLISQAASAGVHGAPVSRVQAGDTVIPVVVPGDLEAAERLFASDQMDEDIATSDLVDGMGIVVGSTRLLQSSATENIWAGKNRDGGICLIVVDSVEGAGGGACTHAEDFPQNGLQLGRGGISFSWDGARLITTTSTR